MKEVGEDLSRDPDLQALFDRAETALPPEDFMKKLNERLDRLEVLARRRRIQLMVGAAILILLQFWILMASGLSATLMASIITIEDEGLRQLLSPLNSIATLLGGVVFLLQLVVRRALK